MKKDRDEWLDQKIEEDLNRIFDEREKFLMENEELSHITMPVDKIEEIEREAAQRKKKNSRNIRVHWRVLLVAAVVMVMFLGFGMVGAGQKLYVPEIFRKEAEENVTTKIRNSDYIPSEYDEEEVCQEIQDKLGVVPVMLGYKPDGMVLEDYIIDETSGEAIMDYCIEEAHLHTYISKDFVNSAASTQIDGEFIENCVLEVNGMEIPIYEVKNENSIYYAANFEFANTYYSIYAMVSRKEFEKIIENLALNF